MKPFPFSLAMAYSQKIFMVLLLVGIAASCAQVSYSPLYYTLEYEPEVTPLEELGLEAPIPVRIQVLNAKLPRTYDRTHIVVRYSAHQINYYRYKLWAVRPSYAIADLVNQHLNRAKIFELCMREYLDEKPDYELLPIVNNIELYTSNVYSAAHLAMSFYLRKTDSQEYVLQFGFDKEIQLPNDFVMSSYAQATSYIIRDQTYLFIDRLIEYFKEVGIVANES